MQRLLDIRQGDVHDRDIEQKHERPEADRDQRPPLVPALTRLGASAFSLAAALL